MGVGSSSFCTRIIDDYIHCMGIMGLRPIRVGTTISKMRIGFTSYHVFYSTKPQLLFLMLLYCHFRDWKTALELAVISRLMVSSKIFLLNDLHGSKLQGYRDGFDPDDFLDSRFWIPCITPSTMDNI